MDHSAHRHGHRHDRPGAGFDEPAAVAFAELDAEVLADLNAEAVGRLAGWCRRAGLDVRRLLDLGCGPGVGTVALAQRFDQADLVAADGSAAMLAAAAAAARAARHGIAHRVVTRPVDLPGGLDGLAPVDVVWASMVVHHVPDPRAALAAVRSVLAGDGVLAVVELADPPRLTPGGTAPDPGGPAAVDVGDLLARTGFEVVQEARLAVRLGPPLDAAALRLVPGHRRGAPPGPDATLEISRRLHLARPV